MDHRVADCRDPTKCWTCGGNGHRSTYCKQKVTPAAATKVTPHHRSQRSQTLLPTPPSPDLCGSSVSLPLMDRRRSLGGGQDNLRSAPAALTSPTIVDQDLMRFTTLIELLVASTHQRTTSLITLVTPAADRMWSSRWLRSPSPCKSDK